jgi:transcriptional antiterminator NusG
LAEQTGQKSNLYIVRTTTGREAQVIDRLVAKLNRETNPEIFAVMKPHEIRGYIFVEATSKEAVAQTVYGVTYAKGVVEGTTKMKDLDHLFAPVAEIINVKKNDVVEVASGPFKGEKARVKRINKLKEEIVIELLEAAVPIPLTIKLDSVRVIRREEKE